MEGHPPQRPLGVIPQPSHFTPAHVAFAAALLSSLPPPLSEAARVPYSGARGRARGGDRIRRQRRGCAARGRRGRRPGLRPGMPLDLGRPCTRSGDGARLPLLNLCAAALSQLSDAQQTAFLALLDTALAAGVAIRRSPSTCCAPHAARAPRPARCDGHRRGHPVGGIQPGRAAAGRGRLGRERRPRRRPRGVRRRHRGDRGADGLASRRAPPPPSSMPPSTRSQPAPPESGGWCSTCARAAPAPTARSPRARRSSCARSPIASACRCRRSSTAPVNPRRPRLLPPSRADGLRRAPQRPSSPPNSASHSWDRLGLDLALSTSPMWRVIDGVVRPLVAVVGGEAVAPAAVVERVRA